MKGRELIDRLNQRIRELDAERRKMVVDLVDHLENSTTRSLYEFARKHADRLGIPLPDGWVPTAERAAIELEAVKAKWNPKWRE